MNPKNTNSSQSELLLQFKATELFKDFKDEILEKLAEKAEWTFLKEGEPLFRRGDPSDALYIAVEGGLMVTITKEDGTEVTAKEIQPGETIGEIQFLTSGKRTAGISASKETKVIRLHNAAFDYIADKKLELFERMNEIARKRLQFNQLAAILPDLFGSLSKDEVRAIVEQAEWVRIKRGEVLCKQGDDGDAFYVVVNGYLEVAVERRNRKRHSPARTWLSQGGSEWGLIVSQIGGGESVGEMSLLTDEKRTGTVYALRDSELFRFSKMEFNRLLEQYPKLLIQISRTLVNRLRTTTKAKKITPDNAIIAVVPANEGAPLRDFALRLTKTLSALKPTLHIHAEGLDQIMETPGISQISENDPNNIRVSAWINSQEQEYRYIVLETDMTASNWTKWCLRQADQILVLTEASADPDLKEIEESLLFGKDDDMGERSHLILLHPNGDRQPSGTQKWLEKRAVAMYHHVRYDTDKDIQRVARFLSGTAVGLALSGGGARGFAHIGALRAMEEAGIPVDMIGGTSMGAILAAQYSIGIDCDTMTRMSCEKIDIFDFTLPISSLLAGGKFVSGLKENFKETFIEDLWLPFFCVSSNLTRAEKKVHRSGILWKSIMASCAAPGILPPVVMDGDLHVDGALLDNLPATVMSGLCNGKVFAVDVSPAVDLAENTCYGERLSGWSILWKKINPFSDPISIPSIRTILQRAGELASVASQKNVVRNVSDLYLLMPVDKYQLVEYHLAPQIIEDGYRYAKEEIAKWKSKTGSEK